MDFKSATIGNKSVVKVTLGNLTIYPRDVFVVDPTFITVDNMSQTVEIVVTSVIGGNAADVTKTVRLDEISMFDYGYITGSNMVKESTGFRYRRTTITIVQGMHRCSSPKMVRGNSIL